MYEQQDDEYLIVEYDIIQISIKYVRQVQVVVVHVRINHRIHIIQVMEMEMLVDGHVMRDIIRMGIHVQHVRVDIQVQHDLQRNHNVVGQ